MSSQVPFELPVFPLPETVLFPGTLLPLHIFEPRYRQLLARCLASNRRMGVALLQPGWEGDYMGCPPIHPIFGMGEIVDHSPYPDGTSDIVLRGVARVRLASYEQETPFRVALVEDLADSRSPVDFDDGVTYLKEAFTTRLPRGLALVVANLLAAGVQPLGHAVDVACATLAWEPAVRQSLLETLDAEERLWHLGAALSRGEDSGEPNQPRDPYFPEPGTQTMN